MLSHSTGVEKKRLERVQTLLDSFLFHRILYEMKDVINHYLAFTFIPLLGLLGIVVMGQFLFTSSAVPALTSELFLGLTLIVLV